MYLNDLTCVKVGDKLTRTFQTNQGVRQSWILSPTLFNIFLVDLSNKIRENDIFNLSEAHHIHNIIWADDLLLIAKNEEDLNKINDLHQTVSR